MQVFNVFFKIIKKNLTEICIYISVFLFFVILASSFASGETVSGFTSTKSNIVFINHDEGSELVEGLKEFIGENANIVDIEDEEKKLQDALFFREIEYIIRVPQGFSAALFTENELKIEKTTVPDSAAGMYIDLMVNKYLNTAKLYTNHLGDVPTAQLLGYIKSDLQNETKVTINSFSSNSDENKPFVYYFNYLSYSLFGIMILGVSAVMLIFNDRDLKRRNFCSPITLKSINTQLVFGNLCFAVISWLVLIIPSFIMHKEIMLSASGLLLLLNSLVFAIAALSISFFIAHIIKSRNAMSAASNVVALGASFISGAFVPQELLGATVLRISSFTPNFWYVKTNDTIADIVDFNAKNLMPVFLNMLIVLGFAAAFLAVTVVLIKQKRTSE